MSWLETLFLADVLSSDKKTAQKKIRTFVWMFFGLIGLFLIGTFLMMVMVLDGPEGEVSNSSKEQRKEALEIIFREHIMPKTLQDGIKTENMDKAISEEIALLKEKQNPLYEDLILMQENYHEFLQYCEKQISKQTNNKYLEGLDDIKSTKQKNAFVCDATNPYHASIQSMIDISQGKPFSLRLPQQK